VQGTSFTQTWERLDQYPIKRGRSDDLHFFSPDTGFVINSGGYLSYTEDGGASWEVLHENPGTFFRCITFRDRQRGWLGTIGTDDPYLSSKDTIALYETSDGGKSWDPVQFIGPTPKGLCGLQKVTDQFIVGCGRVRGPSYFIKTLDGGDTWYSYNLDHLAGSLIAAHFFDEQTGFLIGGTTRDKENSRSMVLSTEDGGMTWDTVYLSQQIGEYPWKFSFTSRETGYISIQRNIKEGRFYHLQTTDGGRSWKEVEHTDSYYYVQGVGFITPEIGWLGGSPGVTYETRDGGKSWTRYKGIGSGFNNFQFFQDTMAYGVGFGVFKSYNIHKDSTRVTRYYDSGTIRGIWNYQDGKRNGIAQTYHPNGSLASKGKYRNNLKHGTWKYYDSNGELVEQTKMRQGILKSNVRDLNNILGTYQLESGVQRKIFVEDGQLYSQRGTRNKLALFPESSTRFYYSFNTDVTVEFLSDSDGVVTHMTTYQDGKITQAERISK